MEKSPKVTVIVVVPHGVMSRPSVFTSLVDVMGFISDLQVCSAHKTEQDAPESNNILMGTLFNFPTVYAAWFACVSVGT